MPTPTAAQHIAASVNLAIVSFSRNQAKIAVRKGTELHMKSVAATVVFVIACNKQIPAVANANPAANPGFPTAIILLTADSLYLNKSIKKTVIDKEMPRIRLISSAPADSIFRIMSPVKLINVDPKTIKNIALFRKLKSKEGIRSLDPKNGLAANPNSQFEGINLFEIIVAGSANILKPCTLKHLVNRLYSPNIEAAIVLAAPPSV